MLRKPDEQLELSSSEDDEPRLKRWDGAAEELNINHEATYEDEDRHTTVTIEAVNITKDGLQKVVDGQDSGDDEDSVKVVKRTATDKRAEIEEPIKSKRVWTKERPGGPKKKKKKFRYESKAERKVTRYKERSGNKAKAKARKD